MSTPQTPTPQAPTPQTPTPQAPTHLPPPPAGPPALRIGDAERLRTSTVLQDAAAAGRLTLDELDERLAVAATARTGPELAALLADLPVPPSRPDRADRWSRVGPAVLVLLVLVLSAAASVRAGFPVVWPVAVLLVVLWRRSRGAFRRRPDLDSNG